MELRSKLKNIARTAFPGAKLRLQSSSPGSRRLAGFLIWNGFDTSDQIDRQERLWKVLDKRLTSDERSKITVILTMTPDEVAVVSGE